jgi:hypothetical protein
MNSEENAKMPLKHLQKTRTILKWKSPYDTQYISKGEGQRTWEIRQWGVGSFILTVGGVFTVGVDISTLEVAMQMAQGIQDILDGYQPVIQLVELSEKIQSAIDNVRKTSGNKHLGTSRSISEIYDSGRADTYVIVLKWIEALEAKNTLSGKKYTEKKLLTGTEYPKYLNGDATCALHD